MRPGWAAYRTPVTWEAALPDLGDGAGWDVARTLFGDVATSRHINRGPQGDAVTDPLRVDFPPGTHVKVGDRLTVDGQAAIVEAAGVVLGPFGVPHHVHVEAL